MMGVCVVTKPVRIQRKRTKGWKKPVGTVCVTRGTFWGNPFVVRSDLDVGAKVGGQVMGTPCVAVPDAESAVETFRAYIGNLPELIASARKTLRGKNLACYCALDQPCHADVLLEVANSDAALHNEFPQAKEVAS